MIKPYVRLYTNRTQSKNGYPVCLCITINNKQIKRTLFHCHEKDWNSQIQRVRKTHPDNQGLNILITNELSETQKRIIDAINHNKPIDKNVILNKVEHVPDDFFSIFQKFIDEKTNIGTIMRLESVANKLRKYVKNSKLPVNQIDLEWITTFEKYLKTSLGNGTNTVNKNMKTLSSVFNFAIRRDYCIVNPFSKYRFRTEKTLKCPLNREEFHLLKSFELKGVQAICRDSFILSVYLRGMRISDLIQLKKEYINGDRLLYKTSKDQEYHDIKLVPEAKSIIDKYSHFSKIYILPLINESKNLKDNIDDRQKRKSIESITAKINKNLKLIAEKCGIKKKISTHIARHTFASFVSRSGAPITVTQQLLGHSSPAMTSVYIAEIESSTELDKATELALNF